MGKHEPYIICRHPEHGVMRWKNGWLQKIPQGLKFQIEQVIKFSDGYPVLLSEVEINKEVAYRDNMRISLPQKKKKRRRCTPSREKNKRTCHYCGEKSFARFISNYKGKDTCDNCLGNSDLEDELKQLRENFRNDPAIMQTNFNTIGM